FNVGLEQANTEAMLQLLAVETGGVASLNVNDFGGVLSKIENDWKSYYSLGYATSATAKDKPKKIDVTVTRPGLKVRSRRSHVERTPDGRLADAVISGLYFQKTYNPLHAALDIGTPKKSGKKVVVSLKFSIPYEKLTLVPDGSRYRGKLVFMGATREDAGAISDVARKENAIDVAAADLPSLAGKAYVFETAMEVKPANQLLSLGLTDGPSRLSSYVQTRIALRPPEDSKKAVN
ncbi:MAG TPA: hypothetical protein VGR00_07700, partial [Thermoanaerobaculia bacterium]|nr:hypothetical protein [Thermoanaerobaculia bacterium]